ncbi:NAD-dependent epimerase [Phytomonospora endophytica]|uniref:Nucleoside-diphosphate-sugar epimerase n=1 Tax=Phytomonospora endophytica TaxID=714109 RepID=A0A841FH65_9ACTN|nr:NAD-dependent epimerase [Phytomonospora endophytica]MBB6035065.1 nucleoside-diphosphate-sugar epimerase [Phytomonospora endophytica]GIG64188.1 NAD-dependent epimerase [Phytomonospora endophytica]
MALHVIIGAGGTAVAAAEILADRGDTVRLVSRRGSGPDRPGVERVALDALETGKLTALTEGAASLVNAAMPAYETWPVTIPPLFRSILTVAENTGAKYVMLGNLYAYGPQEGVYTEDSPFAFDGPKGKVRAEMWLEAKAADDAGRVKAAEVRAGSFLGAGAYSLFSLLAQPNVLSGRLILFPGDPDLPHSFTAVGDAARALVAVADSSDDDDWGRAWHAPMIKASAREVAERLAELTGSPRPRFERLTERDRALLAFGNPFWGELGETEYMSDRPYLVDDSAIRARFGVAAGVLDEVLKQGVAGV